MKEKPRFVILAMLQERQGKLILLFLIFAMKGLQKVMLLLNRGLFSAYFFAAEHKDRACIRILDKIALIFFDNLDL